jgi:hypothetical protein
LHSAELDKGNEKGAEFYIDAFETALLRSTGKKAGI